MKKILVIITTMMILSSLVGCNNKENINTNKNTTKLEDSVSYPKGLTEELGEGIIILSTPDGQGEVGLVPIIKLQDDVKIMQIDLNTSNFNNKITSYVFVDERLVDQGKFDESKLAVNLNADHIRKGLHKVEVIQFEDNDLSKQPILYKIAQYEVKEA